MPICSLYVDKLFDVLFCMDLSFILIHLCCLLFSCTCLYIRNPLYTWNPNDLYSRRSTVKKTRPFAIKTRGPIWVPGILRDVTVTNTLCRWSFELPVPTRLWSEWSRLAVQPQGCPMRKIEGDSRDASLVSLNDLPKNLSNFSWELYKC